MPDHTTEALARCGALLNISLNAVAINYRILSGLGGDKAACAAVVKADAYGLGMKPVARTLWKAGCRDYFVALPEEGFALRDALPDARIHVLIGVTPTAATDFVAFDLIPVLNTPDQIDLWAHHARHVERRLPCDIHVDTGMNRLGLSMIEAEFLSDDPGRLDGLEVATVMSHLACSEDAAHPMNEAQLAAFRKVRRLLPRGRACFANSSGIFLGADYHFDLLRPGVALYGINPRPGLPNPMSQVINLQGKIVQVRDVDSPMTVGYGATHNVTGKGRIATVAVGYADGYHRALSSKGHVYIGDDKVAVVGRVSMDLITLDVTALDNRLTRPGALVDLIGPHNPADLVAADAGTIGYEILTSLGQRYHRVYAGG